MKFDVQKYFKTTLLLAIALMCWSGGSFAQTDGVNTYINPVIPGNHPDQTLMKDGNDYYTAGSSFHWAPNFPIYHSTDLVHWKIISNVVSPSFNVVVANQGPKDGTWQGALAKFAGKYWAFFFIHGGGQYFCTASSMAGPWTAPTLVNGSIGYDNAVFVDDNDKAYMLMKNGQSFAAIQELNSNGQLTGTRMDVSWINANNVYSWAEGPKMCKRNGRYYYFCAGNVYGGQYVLSSATLTGNESSWTRHGNYFKGTASGAFTGPNHISQPVQIADGTWWAICHSYGNNGWEGQGRQSMLFQVFWDANGVPYSNNPNGQPLTAPNLPSNGVNYEFPESDFFASTTRKREWYFHSIDNINKSSLSARPGFLRLSPGSGTTHILQRDPSKNYSLVTKVEINATANGQNAGIRLMNGEDAVFARVYSGYNNGKKIGISFGTSTTEVNNTIGNTVWLKVVRSQHNMTGFFSADGLAWTQVGGTVSLVDLDKAQTNDNAWVGTSIGLYATALAADFDQFSFNHGFDPIGVATYYHYNATSISSNTVSNSADNGWCMIPGVTMESNGSVANQIVVSAASASSNGSLEVWIDNIGTAGKKIATIPIASTGSTSTYKDFTANVSVTGQHDLYLRFVGGANVFRLNTVRFMAGPSNNPPTVTLTAPSNNSSFTTLQSITLTATASDADGTVSKVDFYDGTTLIGTDNSSPYSFTWSGASSGTHSITAIATDNLGQTATSTAVTITVTGVQAPYKGTPFQIPGIIQLEEYDLGGNGLAYLDNSPGSDVTPVVNYRTTEDVDIEACTDAGAGYNIGFATNGEWLEYTVNVQVAGNYDMDLRVACSGDGRTVSLAMDGTTFANNVAIPNTGGWQTWTTISVKNIPLTAGQKVMRLTIGATDYVNLNYVEFKDVVTGLNEETLSEHSLFPNPFTGLLHLEVAGLFDYQLMNIEGQIIEEGKAEDKLDLGKNCPKGMYVVKITQGNKSKVVKVVKE
jgi:xylan 1,4-beta-xylosidase